MTLDVLKKINIDFQNPKYISVNAKQFDSAGRYIEVTCQNNGKTIFIDKTKNYAFVRYRRADGYGLIRSCEITNNGVVKLYLTKEMLNIEGKCYADFVIVESKTPRNPIAENGFFVVDYIYNEEDKSLELSFSPSPNIVYDNEKLIIETIDYNEKKINVCEDPSPFVSYNDTENSVTFASIDKTGNIEIYNAGVLSTMTICINVMGSSFCSNCIEII